MSHPCPISQDDSLGINLALRSVLSRTPAGHSPFIVNLRSAQTSIVERQFIDPSIDPGTPILMKVVCVEGQRTPWAPHVTTGADALKI